MFDVQSPTKDGILALDADASLPETARGMLLAAAGVKSAERTLGVGDFGISKLSEPGNALFWKHMSAGPKAAWGSWSFAMPAKHLGGNKYKPLSIPGAVDGDFREETIVSASGWGGTPPVGSDAIILSTTAHGDHRKIAFAIGGGGGGGESLLIADHLGTNAPSMSSHVSDVDDDEPDKVRHAGLDTIFRVRKWVAPCSPATSTGDPDDPNFVPTQYTIALVGNDSPEGQGFLHTTFGGHDALLSSLMGGPLRWATNKHEIVNHTGDAPMRQGALDTTTLFTNGQRPYDAPLEFIYDTYPEVQKGPIPVKVDLLYDDNVDHNKVCGDTARGAWRWVAWVFEEETPPCDSTKSSMQDTNGNPERTYPESTRVWSDRKKQIQGIYFQPRTELMQGPVDNTTKRRV